MAAPVVKSSFDVAYWLLDRALNDGEYLQPQKLHRLMYLAQAYFAVAYDGRLLMPAVFIADVLGPVEPNVLRACEIQRPPIETRPLPEMAQQFLDSIWRRFGQHSTEHLNKTIAEHAPYQHVAATEPDGVITVASMMDFYGRKSQRDRGVTAVEKVVGEQLMRSQSGKPVAVQKWRPSKPKAAR
jgi:uncharacterized phage-associated protein